MSESRRGSWKKDREDRGLYKRGRTWYVRYADQNGVLQYERVGPSKAVAMKVYQKRKTEISEGRFFPGAKTSFDEIIADAVTRARANYETKYPGRKFKPGTYGIVAAWFKGRLAASITPSEIAEWLAAHCPVPATFNRFRVTLSHAYKIAVENGKVAKNPAILVKLKDENNERTRYLNQYRPDEETALSAVLLPEQEAEVDLALSTGLRWSEQYHLRWSNVDLKRGIITILQAKSGKKEYVHINAEARKALATLRAFAEKSEFVCQDNNYDHHRDWWLAALKAAEITGFNWHDLRHTFASRLVMNGVDIFTVSKLLRHSSKSIQVTMRYAHLADKHLKAAVELASVTKSGTAIDDVQTKQTYVF
jgi:integrase